MITRHDGARTGRVFPTSGKQFVLGTYLATAKGASTAKIVKAARALVGAHAPLAAMCPPPGAPHAAVDGTNATTDPPAQDEATPTTDVYTEDGIIGGIFDIADQIASTSPPAFDREAVGACLGVDPGDMSIAIIEETSYAEVVARACVIRPLLLDELPGEIAVEVMLTDIVLLLADEERSRAEAASSD